MKTRILWTFLFLLRFQAVVPRPGTREGLDLRESLRDLRETRQTKPSIESHSALRGVTILTTQVPRNVFESGPGLHKETPPTSMRDYEQMTDLKIPAETDDREGFRTPDVTKSNLNPLGEFRPNEEIIKASNSEEFSSIENIFKKVYDSEEKSSIEEIGDIFGEVILGSQEFGEEKSVVEMEGSGFVGTFEGGIEGKEGSLEVEGSGSFEDKEGGRNERLFVIDSLKEEDGSVRDIQEKDDKRVDFDLETITRMNSSLHLGLQDFTTVKMHLEEVDYNSNETLFPLNNTSPNNSTIELTIEKSVLSEITSTENQEDVESPTLTIIKTNLREDDYKPTEKEEIKSSTPTLITSIYTTPLESKPLQNELETYQNNYSYEGVPITTDFIQYDPVEANTDFTIQDNVDFLEFSSSENNTEVNLDNYTRKEIVLVSDVHQRNSSSDKTLIKIEKSDSVHPELIETDITKKNLIGFPPSSLESDTEVNTYNYAKGETVLTRENIDLPDVTSEENHNNITTTKDDNVDDKHYFIEETLPKLEDLTSEDLTMSKTNLKTEKYNSEEKTIKPSDFNLLLKISEVHQNNLSSEQTVTKTEKSHSVQPDLIKTDITEKNTYLIGSPASSFSENNTEVNTDSYVKEETVLTRENIDLRDSKSEENNNNVTTLKNDEYEDKHLFIEENLPKLEDLTSEDFTETNLKTKEYNPKEETIKSSDFNLLLNTSEVHQKNLSSEQAVTKTEKSNSFQPDLIKTDITKKNTYLIGSPASSFSESDTEVNTDNYAKEETVLDRENIDIPGFKSDENHNNVTTLKNDEYDDKHLFIEENLPKLEDLTSEDFTETNLKTKEYDPKEETIKFSDFNLLLNTSEVQQNNTSPEQTLIKIEKSNSVLPGLIEIDIIEKNTYLIGSSPNSSSENGTEVNTDSYVKVETVLTRENIDIPDVKSEENNNDTITLPNDENDNKHHFIEENLPKLEDLTSESLTKTNLKTQEYNRKEERIKSSDFNLLLNTSEGQQKNTSSEQTLIKIEKSNSVQPDVIEIGITKKNTYSIGFPPGSSGNNLKVNPNNNGNEETVLTRKNIDLPNVKSGENHRYITTLKNDEYNDEIHFIEENLPKLKNLTLKNLTMNTTNLRIDENSLNEERIEPSHFSLLLNISEVHQKNSPSEETLIKIDKSNSVQPDLTETDLIEQNIYLIGFPPSSTLKNDTKINLDVYSEEETVLVRENGDLLESKSEKDHNDLITLKNDEYYQNNNTQVNYSQEQPTLTTQNIDIREVKSEENHSTLKNGEYTREIPVIEENISKPRDVTSTKTEYINNRIVTTQNLNLGNEETTFTPENDSVEELPIKRKLQKENGRFSKKLVYLLEDVRGLIDDIDVTTQVIPVQEENQNRNEKNLESHISNINSKIAQEITPTNEIVKVVSKTIDEETLKASGELLEEIEESIQEIAGISTNATKLSKTITKIKGVIQKIENLTEDVPTNQKVDKLVPVSKDMLEEDYDDKNETFSTPTPFSEINTLSSLEDDEWLKVINSPPKYEDTLVFSEELLGLDYNVENNSQKNEIISTTVDPFQEVMNSTSISVQKVLGNGRFNSKNLSLIEREEVGNMKLNQESSTSKIDSLIVDQTKSEAIDEYLLKMWPNLKHKEKKALKILLKNIDVATLSQYDLKDLLNEVTNKRMLEIIPSIENNVLTKTFGHALLRADEINENVEICFAGCIGYQFVVKMNEEIQSPKYLDDFSKICIRSHEPILIIQQESSFVEFRFKLVQDVIALQGIHINVNGKLEIDELFTKNITIFDTLIGGHIVVDDLSLEILEMIRNDTRGLKLNLFNVNITSEMYINGKLVAENYENLEEGATTVIISASIGVFCVFFIVFLVLYQFCLRNKSRKMIYILTHR